MTTRDYNKNFSQRYGNFEAVSRAENHEKITLLYFYMIYTYIQLSIIRTLMGGQEDYQEQKQKLLEIARVQVIE